MYPDSDYWEVHEEEHEGEIYVETSLYGKTAKALAAMDVYLISAHARGVLPEATFHALLWDLVSIWYDPAQNELFHHTPEPPAAQATAEAG